MVDSSTHRGRSEKWTGRSRASTFDSPCFRLSLILVGLATLTQTGCVSRRLMVQSNPPGAMVLLEGKEVGYTPTGVDFTYYGTRELTLIKDGYETKTQLVPVRAPWYQWPVIEFFSDNLLPGRITDRRDVQFELEPKRMVPNQELLNRGQILRNEAQIGQ
ncbi:MAG: PEGA domain-containing protein [Planctomycetota bacterium]